MRELLAINHGTKYLIFLLLLLLFSHLIFLALLDEKERLWYDTVRLPLIISCLFIGIRARVRRAKYQFICSKPVIDRLLIF